jgi:hypothetical protein
MMYVTRIISAGDLDKIYNHLLPTTPGVVDGDAEITYVKQMVLELQSDVCHPHELVIRAWFNGPQGQEFLNVHWSIQFVASLHCADKSSDIYRTGGTNTRLPKINLVIFTKDLHLQPDDVAGLWGNIQGFINPNYWNPALWKAGSQYSRTYHDNLRHCSYDLVCKIIAPLTFGPAAQRNISPTYRMKFLSDTTPWDKTPPSFPLPSPDIPAGQDQIRCEIQPPHFLQVYRTIASEALCVHLMPPELTEGAGSSSPAKSPRKFERLAGTAGLSRLQSVAATGPPPRSPHPVTTDGSEVNPSVVITPIVIDNKKQNDTDRVSPGKTDGDTTRNPFINDNESIFDGQS